jgi:hypothetical protein
MYALPIKKFTTKGRKKMFRNKSLRQQMIIVFMMMVMTYVAGTLLGNRMKTDSTYWQIFEFENPAFREFASFTIRQNENQISAILTNESEAEITTGTGFALALQTETDWRIFPFRGDVGFNDIAIILAPGDSTEFSLTEDMLSAKLIPGNYRIVTNIWGEDFGTTQVWAEFELSELDRH